MSAPRIAGRITDADLDHDERPVRQRKMKAARIDDERRGNSV
jgi:hypothetical protein